MTKIDDASYRSGREAFAEGDSMRAVVERYVALEEYAPPNPRTREQREDQVISFALGFFDAAFDRLRGIER